MHCSDIIPTGDRNLCEEFDKDNFDNGNVSSAMATASSSELVRQNSNDDIPVIGGAIAESRSRSRSRVRGRSKLRSTVIVKGPPAAALTAGDTSGPYRAATLSADKLENVEFNTLLWATRSDGPHVRKIDAKLSQKKPAILLLYYLDHDHGGHEPTDYKVGHGHPCEFVYKSGNICGEYFYHRHPMRTPEESRQYPQACPAHAKFFDFKTKTYVDPESKSKPSPVIVAASSIPKPIDIAPISEGLVEAGRRRIIIEEGEDSAFAVPESRSEPPPVIVAASSIPKPIDIAPISEGLVEAGRLPIIIEEGEDSDFAVPEPRSEPPPVIVASSSAPKPIDRSSKAAKHAPSSEGLIEAGLRRIMMEEEEDARARAAVAAEREGHEEKPKEEKETPKQYEVYQESPTAGFTFRHRPYIGFNSDLIFRRHLSYNTTFIGSHLMLGLSAFAFAAMLSYGVFNYLGDVSIWKLVLTKMPSLPMHIRGGVLPTHIVPPAAAAGMCLEGGKNLSNLLSAKAGNAPAIIREPCGTLGKMIGVPALNIPHAVVRFFGSLISAPKPLRALPIPSMPTSFLQPKLEWRLEPCFPAISSLVTRCWLPLTIPIYAFSFVNLFVSAFAAYHPLVSERTYTKIEDIEVESVQAHIEDKDEEFDEMRADRNTYVKLRHIEPGYTKYHITDRVFPDPKFAMGAAMYLGHHFGLFTSWVTHNLVPTFTSDVGEEIVSIELARHVASDIRTDGKEEIIPTRFYESASRAQNTIAICRDYSLKENIIDNTARFLASRNFSIIDRSLIHLNEVAVQSPSRAWPLCSLIWDAGSAVWGRIKNQYLPMLTLNVRGYVTVTASAIAVLRWMYVNIDPSWYTVRMEVRPPPSTYDQYMDLTRNGPLVPAVPIVIRAMSLLSSVLSHTGGLLSHLLWTGQHSGAYATLLTVSVLLLSNPYARTRSWQWISLSATWTRTRASRMMQRLLIALDPRILPPPLFL